MQFTGGQEVVEKGTFHIGFSNENTGENHQFVMQFVEEDVPCTELLCRQTKTVFGVKDDLGEHRCDMCDWYYGRLWEREW